MVDGVDVDCIPYQKSKNQVLKDAFRGSGSGAVAAMVACPLEIVKMNIQNMPNNEPTLKTAKLLFRKMWAQGLGAFYKGLGATMIGYFSSNAIYFAVYESMNRFLQPDPNQKPQMPLYFISAAFGGATSTFLTNPIWVVRTRLMTQNQNSSYRYNGIADAFYSMFKNEGWRSFFKGIIPSMFGVMHVAISFPIYEHLKWELDVIQPQGGSINVALATATSKIIATSITYPHEVIRTRLHTSQSKTSIMTLIKEIYYRQGGIKSFYKGLSLNLLKSVPTTVALLVTYEYGKS